MELLCGYWNGIHIGNDVLLAHYLFPTGYGPTADTPPPHQGRWHFDGSLSEARQVTSRPAAQGGVLKSDFHRADVGS